MGKIQLDNGVRPSPFDEEQQYETGNEGERDRSGNAKGGKDGEKLDKAMKRKYPQKSIRGGEYR